MRRATSPTASPAPRGSQAAFRAATTGNSGSPDSGLVGLEGDIQASRANDTFAAWKFSNPWFGTLRGRGGFAMNNILLYGTGGLAFGNVRAEVMNLTENHSTAGWTLGAGAEYGFADNWTAKAEYLYVNLNNTQFALTGLPNGYQFSIVRLGVNYKF